MSTTVCASTEENVNKGKGRRLSAYDSSTLQENNWTISLLPFSTRVGLVTSLEPLFHSSQKATRKLAASAFEYYDWMKALAASLQVGF